MLMDLMAVKNINFKQTKFIPYRRGRMELVTLPTGGAPETRWLCAEIPAKIFIPVLGLSIRMSWNRSRRKTPGSRSAEEA